MTRKIVAGNWKMNLLLNDANSLFDQLVAENKGVDCEIVICPPSIYLHKFTNKGISVGAQNVSQFSNGAYTGELSAAMLKSIGVNYCIVGHSERRECFCETDEDVNLKVHQLLLNGIKPIVCCGESLDQRESGIFKDVIETQIREALKNVSSNLISELVIAYEPIWAIGTGVTASSVQAQEVHAFIREILSSIFGSAGREISILYGGSCKPNNALELFSCNDIDGGLIGGASLEAESFIAIAKSF
ncbi:MAG: triose-phosphate isomerase [Flavobacteriales bacterium]|nr:triose-phosphate isomerase [Flavobacteriales bacterium]